MAGSLSNYAEKSVLAHSVGKTAWAFPTTVYIALYTVAPNENTDGAEVQTAIGSIVTGYERFKAHKSLSENPEIWAEPTEDGTITNAVPFVFGPASTTWGDIEGVAVINAASGGTPIWYGTFTSPRTVVAGEKLIFDAGAFVLSLN